MKTLIAMIVIAFLFQTGVLAQDTKPSESASTLATRTELVLVPTLVREKSGAPITGLAKGDFTLLENGAERTIAVFEEVRTSAVTQRWQTPPSGEFSNYLANQPVPGRLTIIVVDSINTKFSNRAYAREQVLKFLGELGKGHEPIALLQLTRGGAQVIHDFTTDPSVLAKALRSQSGGPAPVADDGESLPDTSALASANAQSARESQMIANMLDNMEQNFLAAQRMLAAQVTLDGMQQIARAYAAVPGRKSLIWASGGFPFSIDDLSRLIAGEAPLRHSYFSDILPMYEKTWQALNDANIVLYPVDVRGLATLGVGAERHVTATGLERENLRISSMHMDTLATFNQFADMTGGKAYFNTNDLVTAFHDAVDDSGSYYLLGFYLAPDDHKPGWRKLQVKVKPQHAQVRSRNGFYVLPEDKDKAKSRQNDLELAVASPLDFTTLRMLARWTETTSSGNKKRAAFELVLPADAALVVESDQNHLNIDFDAAARESTGKVVASNGRTLDAHLKPESLQQIRSSGITYKGALELAPGEYSVRFVVRDNLTGRMGSVTAPLTIAAQ